MYQRRWLLISQHVIKPREDFYLHLILPAAAVHRKISTNDKPQTCAHLVSKV